MQSLKFYIGGLVIILAVSYAVLNNAMQGWDSNEGTLYNLLLSPLPLEMVLNKPINEQVECLNNITRDLEKDVPEFLVRWWYGEDFVTASFGPTQTKVAEVMIPSRDGDKAERDISVVCTRPTITEASGGVTTPLPLVLHFQYGGLLFGSAKSELILIRYISHITNAVVCSPTYRRAPEYPYPAAIDDALDASLFLIQNGGTNEKTNPLLDALDVTIDPSKVATIGTSAGGYLSGHVARQLAVKEGIPIKLQVSIVPMVKPFGGTQSLQQYGDKDIWSEGWNTYAWESYLTTKSDDSIEKFVNDWRVNLLVDPPRTTEEQEAKEELEVLDRLPPVYLQLHKRCPLYDEGMLYAQKLKEHGKLLELVEYNSVHVTGLPPFSNGGSSDGSFERAVKTLKTHLHHDDENAAVL